MRDMDPATANPRSKRLTRRQTELLVVVAVLSVAVLLALGSPLIDHDSVANKRDLASVDLGLPMPWLHQDQSVYSPPLPAHLGPVSPWNNPTSISLGTLLADVALAFLAMAVIVGLLAAAFTWLRPSSRA